MKKLMNFMSLFVLMTLHAQSKPIESIPFVIERNHIYLNVKVNEIDSLKFLFDTGADGSCVNQDSG